MPLPDHTNHSSYREMVLEHLFVGEIMRHCWQCHLPRIEMLKSQVDASGYDIVLESGGVKRHGKADILFNDAGFALIDFAALLRFPCASQNLGSTGGLSCLRLSRKFPTMYDHI